MSQKTKVRALKLPITVAIITRNRPKQIIRCLNSIVTMYKQPMEILVIDSSPFPNVDIKKQFPTVNYSHVQHVSAGYSRNICIDQSSNSLLAFIDDDEVASKHWLDHLYEAYKQTKAPLISGPMYAMFTDNYWNQVWDYLTSSDYTDIDRYVQFANTGNLLIDKKMIGTITFDSTMRTSEDADFYIRIIQNGRKIFYTHQAVVYHEYRTSLKGFFMQWFYYGFEDAHILAKQNIGMRRWYSIRTFYKALADLDLITPLTTVPLYYVFGLAIKNCALILGSYIRRTKIFIANSHSNTLSHR